MKFAQSALAILAILLAGLAGATPAAAKTAAAASGAILKSQPPTRKHLVDLNHASLEQLKALPGIGDAVAAKIVKNRPYQNKLQLSSKGVISAAAYARIRTLIIAKQ